MAKIGDNHGATCIFQGCVHGLRGIMTDDACIEDKTAHS